MFYPEAKNLFPGICDVRIASVEWDLMVFECDGHYAGGEEMRFLSYIIVFSWTE